MSGIQLDPLIVMASLPSHYARSRMWKNAGNDTDAHRRTLVSPDFLTININNIGHVAKTEVSLDLNSAATWDSVVVDYTIAASRAGKQFYIYACIPAAGRVPTFLCSANSTYPTGYSSVTSRCVGTFHCMCVAAGNISGHSLTGYLAGDILPRSIQDLIHRPRAGFIPGIAWGGVTDFDSLNYRPVWKAIYMASGTSVNVASIFGAVTSVSRDWNSFVADFGLIGCRMMDDDEFQVLCAGIEEEVNITGSANPTTTGGHISTTGRRMISNIGSEDDAGVWWQWIRTQSWRLDYDGSVQAASQTATITYVASLEGVPVYLKWDGPVPYLCANITADLWIACGSYKIQLKADASASSGTQVYFKDTATNPLRLYSAVVNGLQASIQSSNPDFSLPIVYSASPASQGVALYYDNVTHSRLEAINSTLANATIDLATTPGWSYYDLPTGVGSCYKQGGLGDVKLRAGGSWTSGATAGSRCRSADCCRWHTYSYIGSRFVAEPA